MYSQPHLLRLIAVALAGIGLAVCGFCGASARAQSADQRFVAGLRERRLYDLAELFCREKLAQTELSPMDQADLLIQWVQTQVARASGLPIDQQNAAWDAARQTLEEFLQTHPNHPRRELLVVQHALTLLARGQLLRQEWEMDPQRSEWRAMAAETLREANAELSAADRVIVDLLPERQRQSSAELLSTAQLMALQNNVQYQLAQCFLNSALLYGADQSAARVDSLTQIQERLDQIKRRVQPDDPLNWKIVALRMECARRLNNYTEAEAIGSSIDWKTLPNDARADLWNERIQNALAQDKTDAAIAWLPELSGFYVSHPQLCLSLVELFLDMAAKTAEPRERQTWQERADQTIRVLETYHGPYWVRRANLLLLDNSSEAHRSGHRDLIVRVADELVRKEQYEEALQILDLAAQRAEGDGQPSDAIELAVRAAYIQQSRGRHREAVDRLRLTSAAYPQQALAAEAHLAACWNLAKLIPDQPELLEEYERLLREHLQRWPNSKTADQAASWLLPILRRQKQWTEILQVVSGMQPQSAEFAKAVGIACAAITVELARTAREAPEQLNEQARQFQAMLADWSTRATGDASAENSSALSRIGEARIQIGLAYLDMDLNSAIESLRQLLTSTDESQAQKRVLAWLALCRALNGESVSELERGTLSVDDGGMWLQVAEARRTEKTRGEVAKLIATQSESLRKSGTSLDRTTTVRWEMAMAESLWDSNQTDQAAERFAALQAQYPDIIDIQVRFARMIERDSSTQWAQKGVELWRAIGASAPLRSDIWFTAKLELARLLVAQDKWDEAEKVLVYLQTVPPGWEQSKLKSEFEALLGEIQRRNDGR